MIPSLDFFSAERSEPGFSNALIQDGKMKIKSYRFAAVAAVLLTLCLVFVAPVGAVTEIKPVDFCDSPDNYDFQIVGNKYYFVPSSGDYTLTGDATGIIVVKDLQNVRLTASHNAKLTGGILVKNSSVEITGMHIIGTNEASHNNGEFHCAIRVMEGSKIVATGNTFEGKITITRDDDKTNRFAALYGYTINPNDANFDKYYLADGSVFSNNIITGGVGNVINLGLVKGKVTVEDNTVEMKATSNGQAFFKVYAADETTDITVKDNKITDSGTECQAYVVHVNQYNSDETEYYKNIKITMSGNTYAKKDATPSDVPPFLYYANYPVNAPPASVKLLKGNEILLIPGINQDGVAWTVSSGDVYALTISAPGEYSLTEGFTASTIKITSSNVALNGNNHLISVNGNSGKIVVGKDLDGKVLDISNVELININLKSTAHPKATADGLIEIYGQTTVRGCTIDSSECVDIGSAVLASIWVTGANADGTQIIGNTIELPSKEGNGAKNVIAGIRINAVPGKCIVENNNFVFGKSVDTATNTLGNVYAVQIQTATAETDVEISENTIKATTNDALNNGVYISISIGSKQPSLKVYQNQFNAESGVTYGKILDISNPCRSTTNPQATPENAAGLELELKSNTISSTDCLLNIHSIYSDKDAPWLTLFDVSGVVEDNTGVINTGISVDPILENYEKLTIEKLIIVTTISAPEKVGFDSVKVGYTQPEAKTVSITNNGYIPVVLEEPVVTSSNYIIGKLSKTTLLPGDEAKFTVQPKEGLAVGNYADTITIKTDTTATAEIAVSFLVYQPSSGGSNKPVEEPEEPVVEPETPTEEPVAGEVTVETEVTDGGEVELETPATEGEGGSAAADEDETKITGVVLPTGTDSEVTFVPVSEQAAPEGKETQTKKVFEINVPTYEKGKAAVIKFQMTVEELAADGKEAADVALWHFDEETGEWTKLVTSYTIVDGIVYFEAITNDFSPFAIVYEDEPVDEPVDEPETPASPAPVLGLITALGAAVLLRRK